MVAQHTNTPGEPPRTFSSQVEEALLNALRAAASGETDITRDALNRAVRAAGRDARERSLRPEELVLAFKKVEQRLVLALPGTIEHERHRSQAINALLEAYFGPE